MERASQVFSWEFSPFSPGSPAKSLRGLAKAALIDAVVITYMEFSYDMEFTAAGVDSPTITVKSLAELDDERP